MNSFNKTEADICPAQAVLSWAFPFFTDYSFFKFIFYQSILFSVKF